MPKGIIVSKENGYVYLNEAIRDCLGRCIYGSKNLAVYLFAHDADSFFNWVQFFSKL